MTVYLATASLRKRGLANYKKIGKRHYWYATDKFIGAEHSDINILQGKDTLYKVWSKIAAEPAGTRILGIQPTSSIKYSLAKVESDQKIHKLQADILNKPIIIDGILSEDYYEFIADLYKDNKPAQIERLKSFLDRGTSITFIPQEYFINNPTELLIFPNAAYISDWQNEISIEIKNSSMISFLRELYRLVQVSGRKIDQNTYLRKLIANLEN